jgi:hypothetical protein
MSDAQDSGLGDVLANASGDRFTETTSTSWLQRIVSSFVGALIGLILVIASIVGIFWNEGHAVGVARGLAEGAGLVVSLEAGAVDPSNEGKLVHVAGPASATATLVDPQFAVKANGLKLTRNVEMYQWRQDEHSETHNKLGGGQETVTTYTYSRVWKDGRNDSQAFRHPEGHANPEMPYSERQFVAADAKLGGFSLPPNLIGALGGESRLDVDPAALAAPSGQGRPQQVVDGAIYIGSDPSAPRIGDLKVSYALAPNGPVSAIARQSGGALAPYETKNGQTLYMIDPGEIGAAAMFKEAEDQNAILTWVLRVVALAAMWIGFALAFAPISVVASVIPFLGGLAGFGAGLVSFVLTFTVGPLMIAIAWFTVRPLMSIGLVVAGLAIAFGVTKLRSPRRLRPT